MCWLVRYGSLHWTVPSFLTFSFAESLRTSLNVLSAIIGSFILISILSPWFLIAVAIVFVLYAMVTTFYRANAREMKVRASQTRCLKCSSRDIPSDSTLFCGRRYIPISQSPYRGLQLSAPTGKKVDS